MSTSEIVITVLTSAGGAGAIIVGLSVWLGNVWAKRIAQAEKAAHDKELARLNSSLEIERKRIEVAHTQVVQMAVGIDLDLRKRRIEVYKELWESTGLLPKWPKAKNVTYEDLRELSESLREWYFKKGGMFTSRKSHTEAYSPLQEEIQIILAAELSGPLKEEDYDRVRGRCSALRTALTDDIVSRRALPPEILGTS